MSSPGFTVRSILCGRGREKDKESDTVCNECPYKWLHKFEALNTYFRRLGCTVFSQVKDPPTTEMDSSLPVKEKTHLQKDGKVKHVHHCLYMHRV